MLRRFLNYRFFGPTLQVFTTAEVVVPFARRLSVAYVGPCDKSQEFVSRRFYSEKVKVEELIVDYNHVKTALSDPKILIIDVREPEEVKEHGKIPNSINIPLGTVSTVLGTMPDGEFEKTYKRSKPTEDSEIIFYCMIGKRSGMAQQNAINLGYKNVKNYLGSWTEWATKVN